MTRRYGSAAVSLLRLLLAATALSSCDRYLDIVPVGDVIPTTEQEYRATLNSGYSVVPSQMLLNMRGLVYDHMPDPWGMNLDAYDLYRTIHTWADTDDNDGRSEPYPYYSFYKSIFYSNSVILADPATVEEDDPEEDFDQILSEAYALRAYNYFSLVSLYGPKWSKEKASTPVVPINDDIDTEQKFPPATLGELYDMILSDLEKAMKYSRVERYTEARYRYRLSGEAILTLGSRIHLHRSEWQEALDYARKALAISDSLTDLKDMAEDAVLPTDYRSAEAIAVFTPQQVTDISGYLSIQPTLIEAYKEGDLRRTKYYSFVETSDKEAEEKTGYYLMAKVGNRNLNVTLRRAELYLTASEAAARLGDEASAKDYLTTLLRHRFTAETFPGVTARIARLTGDELLDEILLQRRLELSGEGHDWLDFKRTDQPELTKVVRGETVTLAAGDPRYVIPLPAEARDNNPLL